MEDDARDDELGGDAPVERDVPASHRAIEDDHPATGSIQRSQRGWLLPVLIGALVVALATAGVFGTLFLTGEVSREEVGDVLAEEAPEVEDRAGTVANLLLNYDSTNLEEVSNQMLEIATGNFREQYEEVLAGGAGLGAALEEASASSRGSILDGPDVYFRNAAEAIAIMRVTQTAQSNSNPGGSTIDYVLKVTLIDTSAGGWKADRVEVLSTQQV